MKLVFAMFIDNFFGGTFMAIRPNQRFVQPKMGYVRAEIGLTGQLIFWPVPGAKLFEALLQLGNNSMPYSHQSLPPKYLYDPC